MDTSELLTEGKKAPAFKDAGVSEEDRGSASSPSSSSSSTAEEVLDKSVLAAPDQEELIPIPPPVPKTGLSILANKLWIGNLDKRLNEQNILRFVMKYGTIVSFRYLFKTGPERPETREYVFVEYSTREEAEKAKTALDGKKALGKKIIADWAKQDQGAARKNPYAVSETWDASSVSETLDKTASTSSKIAALEAKLKRMNEEDPFSGAATSKKRKLTTTHYIRHPPKGRSTGASKRNLIYRPSRQIHRKTNISN